MRLTGAAKSGADAVLQFLGSTRHLLPLLLVAALLASTLTPRSHHVSTPQHHGRATHIHTPQHALPRPAGRSVPLPLGNIDPRDARLARPLRWDDVPSATASLLAHAWTRGPPLAEPVAA
jgi:hypothetical protein